MFCNFKKKMKEIPKDAIKEELKKHYPEILQGMAVILLLYLCVRSRQTPVTVNVNVSGGATIL